MLSVIVFGDSVSYGIGDKNFGWPGYLQKYIEKQCPRKPFDYWLYNLGIPSDNSKLLLKRFDAETKERCESKKETIIVFAIGKNDTHYYKNLGRITTSERQYESNLKKLIKKARKYADNIVFVGLALCDESKTNPVSWDSNVCYFNKAIKQYNSILKNVCEKEKVEYIDVLSRFGKNTKSYLDDGLHPNSKGHKLIYEQIKPFFVKFLKKNFKNL